MKQVINITKWFAANEFCGMAIFRKEGDRNTVRGFLLDIGKN